MPTYKHEERTQIKLFRMGIWSVDHLLGGLSGGFVSTIIVHPLDFLKVRMGIWSVDHLLGGLSGGFVSTIIVHPLDFLKVRMGIWSVDHLLGGLSGGFVSTIIVHPLDFLKVRMGIWSVDHLLGGLSGGFVSTIIVHPLDFLKVRMGIWSVDHLLGGLSGGFVSTIIVHPLDFLKVRMGIWSVDHLLGGLSGGFVSTIIVHPLDFLKVRFAANEGQRIPLADTGKPRPNPGGYWATARSVVRSSGFRGLYQGLSPNLVGNTLAWGLYFHLFNTLKTAALSSGQNQLPAHFNLLIGVVSGVGTLTVTNPIWVAKTRLCLQYEGQTKRYRGLVHVLLSILRQDGIRGLYAGFLPGLVGTSHGAVQFMAYEELRKVHSHFTGRSVLDQLGASEYILMAALSKLVAVSATYPYQVVRTRLQDQHTSYTGVSHVIRETWRYEGLRGFYKGLVASLGRVVPATAVTFLVYENVSHEIRRRRLESQP